MTAELTTLPTGRFGGALTKIETPLLDRHLVLFWEWDQARYDMVPNLAFPPDEILTELERECAVAFEPLGRDRAVKGVAHLLSGLPPRGRGSEEEWRLYGLTLIDVLAPRPVDVALEAVQKMRLTLCYPPTAGELTKQLDEVQSSTKTLAQRALIKMRHAEKMGRIGRSAAGRYRYMMASPDDKGEMLRRVREREEREERERKAQVDTYFAELRAKKSAATQVDEARTLEAKRQAAVLLRGEAGAGAP